MHWQMTREGGLVNIATDFVRAAVDLHSHLDNTQVKHPKTRETLEDMPVNMRPSDYQASLYIGVKCGITLRIFYSLIIRCSNICCFGPTTALCSTRAEARHGTSSCSTKLTSIADRRAWKWPCYCAG